MSAVIYGTVCMTTFGQSCRFPRQKTSLMRGPLVGGCRPESDIPERLLSLFNNDDQLPMRT
jgi:hypothetical protein